MEKVLISGCSGFIGGALTKNLLAQNTAVYGLAAHPEKVAPELLTHKKFHLITCPFNKYVHLADLVDERGFDAFLHMAWEGYGNATNDYRVQVNNVLHTCEAAYGAASLECKRFVLADSSHEFLTSVNDDGETGLCSIYGAAKYSSQRMCRVIAHNAGMQFIGVLFTNIFGEGDRSNRSANFFLRKLIQGEDLDLVPGTSLYDWTYIDDCVGGVLAAAEHGVPGKVYYVGSRQLRPFSEILTEVRDVVSPSSKLNFGRYPDNGYIDYSGMNIYELYNDTGYLPHTPFDIGIKKCVEWLNQIDHNKD